MREITLHAALLVVVALAPDWGLTLDGEPIPEKPDRPRPAMHLSQKALIRMQPQRRPDTLADVLRRAVRIDADFPVRLMQAPAQRRSVTLLCPTWCKECGPAKDYFGRGHPMFAVRVETVADERCPQFPAIRDEVTDTFHVGTALKSWDALVQSLNRAAKDHGAQPMASRQDSDLRLGAVDGAVIDQFLRFAVLDGKIDHLGNETFSVSQGAVGMEVPAQIGATWMGGNPCRVALRPKPLVGIGPAKLLPLNAVVIDRPKRKVTLELDGWWDATLEIE